MSTRGHQRDTPEDAEGQRSPEEWQAHARNLCLRWLGARPHTRVELREKLARKGIPEDVSESVLDRLTAVSLIDDAEFAEAWVRSRHTHAGRGRRALAVELRRKGVEDEHVDQALSTISDDAERSRAYALAAQRIERTNTINWSDRAEQERTTRKLIGMLSRRGYAPGLAYSVVTQVIAERCGAEIELPDPETTSSDL
ncbi:regulatory protein RecX [Hoyosella subflava]|uniref:regulatory protein RecX n=1 Tax=Hoyosella subflava TaxID=639313 RepID=UPI00030369FD|nr:regulatory protein RecX [Hoyosella subflava]